MTGYGEKEHRQELAKDRDRKKPVKDMTTSEYLAWWEQVHFGGDDS